jgi:8-oxo-dGTP pyrophosphatase MutT (NUDIX family)
MLMMRRHRWIIDRWVWEMAGGYVDDHEQDAAVSAAREVEEETGWRPRTMRFLCSFQPMVGTADAENLLYLARGADDTGAVPDINEAQQLRWIPLDERPEYATRHFQALALKAGCPSSGSTTCATPTRAWPCPPAST